MCGVNGICNLVMSFNTNCKNDFMYINSKKNSRIQTKKEFSDKQGLKNKMYNIRLQLLILEFPCPVMKNK